MSQETEIAGQKASPQVQATTTTDHQTRPISDQPRLNSELNNVAPAQESVPKLAIGGKTTIKMSPPMIQITKAELYSAKREEQQARIERSPETPKAPASSGNINDENLFDYMAESQFSSVADANQAMQKRPSTVRNLLATTPKQTVETSKKTPQTSKQVTPGAVRLEKVKQLNRGLSTNNQDNGGSRSMGLSSQNMKSVTISSINGSSYPHPLTNMQAPSNCNISINTSTNKLTFDEEDNLQFSDEDEGEENEEDQNDDSVDNCVNMRFVKHRDCISKRKLRTIHRGYDNESGCEIAWTTYMLHHYKHEQLLRALDQVKEIHHTNILRVFYYEIRKVPTLAAAGNQKGLRTLPRAESSMSVASSAFHTSQIGHHQPEELIVVSELITAGSIREYLKKIKTLKLNVIKKWCLKVLEALQFLHERGIVHGELSCETIYINSNNGEIKVGDVGIKHIHTLSKSHELGSCKRYRDEKGSKSVDVFCFGLTLLEIVAASEVSPGRFTLKYIIRIMNEEKKDELLDDLTYEPMRDFLKKSLEDDPQKRWSVQELLNHPFLQESNTAENVTYAQLSVGMGELMDEQIAFFKQQRDKNQTSKISNSLQHSMLNDTALRKYRSSKKNRNNFRGGQTAVSHQPGRDLVGKYESREQSSSIDIASASATAPGAMAVGASNISEFNLEVKQCEKDETNGAKDAVESAISQQNKILAAAKESGTVPQKQEAKRQRKLTKGKTTSLLEIPYSASKRCRRKQVQPKLNGLYQLRDKSLGFASATYPSSTQRKFSMGSSAQATQTKLSKDGEMSQKNSEETKHPLQPMMRHETAFFGRGQSSDRLSQTPHRPPSINVGLGSQEHLRRDYDNEEHSPTQTQTTENVIHFRIQIVAKGRKSDVKFPFDLIKDTPEAVANELQDYYKQNGSELPARAIEAIIQEIQRGIDSHYQFQQPTITEGSQAQTQHSYSNTVVISKDKSPPSDQKSSSLPKSHFNFHKDDAPLEEEKESAANPIDEQAQMEERAQRLEQEQVEQQLAHDYLSKISVLDPNSGCGSSCNHSPPQLESSSNESRDIHEKGLMQAEIMQKLHAGQITIDEFEIGYQQARRKVSISHNSNHRNNPNQLYQEDGLASNANHMGRKYANSSIDELQSENSAAKIEIEPQFSYNNTTGERHGQIIQEQQKNGPYGQQDILLYRNSIEYNDPDLVNFMHNPDKDKHRKDRNEGGRESVKSEEQEDLWLLREMFPNYAQNYHENYVNNYLNHAAQPTQLQHSSAADVHTSMYTTDLSFHSQDGSHHFLDTQRSDLQLNGEFPFALDLSVIMLPYSHTNQTQTSGLITIVQPRSEINEETQVKPVFVGQPAGDSSSQQCQMHSDCDEAQLNKNVAQENANPKNGVTVPVPIHQQSFLDFSESIIKDFVKNDSNRPPSGLSQQTQNQKNCKNGGKLNNSHGCTYGGTIGPAGNAQYRNNTILLQTQPSTTSGGNLRESYSFHAHQLNATKRAAMQCTYNNFESNTARISEIPDVQQFSSAGSGTQETKTSKPNTLGSKAAQDARSTFEGQLGSQISDSQNNSNGLTHNHQRTGPAAQHAITYSKDQGQIKVISSSTEHSTTTANHFHPQAKEEDNLNEMIQTLDRQPTPEVPNADHIRLQTTPSVIDIKKTQESQREDDQSSAALFGRASILHQSSIKTIKTQSSIKGIPNILTNHSGDIALNNSAMIIVNPNPRISAASDHLQNPQTQSSSYDNLTDQSSLTVSERLSPSRVRFPPPSQQMNKFSWRDSSEKLSAASSAASMSTAAKDLQRLLEIKKRGMKSERLAKGFQKGMLKKDVNNCKFMLNLLSQSQENLSSKESDVSASTKFDQLLIEDGHYDRHTRSLVKLFKKCEGIIGAPTEMNTVDNITWDALLDCAFQYVRAQLNVNRVVPLESVQEQEEDQKFEETHRLETLCEATCGEDDEEDVGNTPFGNQVEESSQEKLKESQEFNQELSFQSLRHMGDKVVVKGRFSTIIKLSADEDAGTSSKGQKTGSQKHLGTSKGVRLSQFSQKNCQSAVFESKQPENADFAAQMSQSREPEDSNRHKLLQRQSSSLQESDNTPSFNMR